MNNSTSALFSLKGVRYLDILHVSKLEIMSKEVSCIVGPSGSGKSTLLRLLNRLISPDHGTIKYGGTNLADLDPVGHRREVVMLAQNPVIVDGTIRDNLRLGCEYSERELPTDDAMATVLQRVHLDKPLDATPEHLSGGERQRLALARVLLMNPPVYLLDEPSSALDEDTELAIFETITDWAGQNDSTLVMVTHSTTIARQYADRIVHLAEGGVRKVEVLSDE